MTKSKVVVPVNVDVAVMPPGLAAAIAQLTGGEAGDDEPWEGVLLEAGSYTAGLYVSAQTWLGVTQTLTGEADAACLFRDVGDLAVDPGLRLCVLCVVRCALCVVRCVCDVCVSMDGCASVASVME